MDFRLKSVRLNAPLRLKGRGRSVVAGVKVGVLETLLVTLEETVAVGALGGVAPPPREEAAAAALVAAGTCGVVALPTARVLRARLQAVVVASVALLLQAQVLDGGVLVVHLVELRPVVTVTVVTSASVVVSAAPASV